MFNNTPPCNYLRASGDWDALQTRWTHYCQVRLLPSETRLDFRPRRCLLLAPAVDSGDPVLTFAWWDGWDKAGRRDPKGLTHETSADVPGGLRKPHLCRLVEGSCACPLFFSQGPSVLPGPTSDLGVTSPLTYLVSLTFLLPLLKGLPSFLTPTL